MQREYGRGFRQMINNDELEFMKNPPLLGAYDVDIEKICSKFNVAIERIDTKSKSIYDTITDSKNRTIAIKSGLTKPEENVALAYGLAYIVVDKFFNDVFIPTIIKTHAIDERQEVADDERNTIDKIQQATYDNFAEDLLLPENIFIMLFDIAARKHGYELETMPLEIIDILLSDIANATTLPVYFVQDRFAELSESMI